MARLFFPTGPAEDPSGVGDDVLTVLTMPGLVLPPPGVNREHWSTSEQLAVPLLHLACWYATRAIYGRPRAERKLIALDETHFLADWGAGRSLFTRLGRDSRKWNTCVLAASQNPSDVLGMEVSNFISSAFVGRIEDDEVAADALRMLRIPAGVGYESVLARLSPRGAPGERSRIREFVMRDVDGNVDRMRVDLDHLPELLAALDTTARTRRRDELPAGPAEAAFGVPALPPGRATVPAAASAASASSEAAPRSAAAAGWVRVAARPHPGDAASTSGSTSGRAATAAGDGTPGREGAPPGSDGQGVHVA
jgi:AAA-like domain